MEKNLELGLELGSTQRYKNQFDHYVSRRIFQCGPHLESKTDHPNIFVKLDSRYDNYTGSEIKRFCRKLSETLHVSSKCVMRLCQIHVDEGCIQLTFQVPLFVRQKIFPLSKEQEKALGAMGVTKLTCGEYQFLVRLSESTCLNTLMLLLIARTKFSNFSDQRHYH